MSKLKLFSKSLKKEYIFGIKLKVKKYIHFCLFKKKNWITKISVVCDKDNDFTRGIEKNDFVCNNWTFIKMLIY